MIKFLLNRLFSLHSHCTLLNSSLPLYSKLVASIRFAFSIIPDLPPARSIFFYHHKKSTTAMKAIIVLIFFQCASATAHTNHTIDGASGWDLSSDIQAWAGRTTFRVGDSLVFRVSPVHNVLEVRKTDYDLCQTLHPLKGHNDLAVVIRLRKAGNRYFICGWLGHCEMGLKLHVHVLPALQMSPNVSATSPSSPLITRPPSNTCSPSSNNCSRHGPDDQVVGNDHVN